MKFEELNIDERILRAVEDMGFEEASPIQANAIPAVLEGRDVVGKVQTGSDVTENRPGFKKGAGNRTLSDQRTCCAGI